MSARTKARVVREIYDLVLGMEGRQKDGAIKLVLELYEMLYSPNIDREVWKAKINVVKLKRESQERIKAKEDGEEAVKDFPSIVDRLNNIEKRLGTQEVMSLI